MISVKNYFHNIPEILISENTKHSLKLLLKKNEEDIEHHIYTDDTVKEALRKIYHDKCAYCESKLKHIEINHYRPLDKYRWLAYEWSNLLPVCPDCKKSKALQFPVKGRQVKTPQQDKNKWRADSESFMTEEPLVLHPGIDKPENHLYFDVLGKIHPKNNSETIDICGLNRPNLITNRKAIFKVLSDNFEMIRDENIDLKEGMKLKNNIVDETINDRKFIENAKYVTQHLTSTENYDRLDIYSSALAKLIFDETLTTSDDIFFDEEKERRLPISIKQFQIKNYQGIIKTGIKGIPLDTQWIFLTGENGFGKTCVLQAVVIGLFGNRDKQEILTDDDCNISVELKEEGENRIYRMGIPKFEDFAAYGPSRLNHQAQESQNKISRKSSPTYSLFHTDGILLNIEYNLVIWHLKKDPRYEIVTQALLNILPYITEIKIADEQVFYTESETEESGKTYQPMPFEKLASGHRGIIAMIGDMLIRFFRQQPDVRRTEYFKGIVFIDELDSHLHPKWQRELPALLSEVFPNVQFVASTHSVIPFLGAPENSVFLKVTRNREQGIQIERVKIDIRNLLPNTLLTSPLFDMERLSQRNNKNLAEVRTEETYGEMTKNDEIRARLEAFEESNMDFPDALFETGENSMECLRFRNSP